MDDKASTAGGGTAVPGTSGGTVVIPGEISPTPEGAHCGHGLPDDPGARAQAVKAQELAGEAFKGILDIPRIVDEAKREILHEIYRVIGTTAYTKTVLDGVLEGWKDEWQKQRQHTNLRFDALEGILAIAFHPPPATGVLQPPPGDRKEKLLADLIALQDSGDPISANGEADRLIVEFIGDTRITEAHRKVTTWYPQ